MFNHNAGPGIWKAFTETQTSTSTQNTIDVLAAIPGMRKWKGAKQFHRVKAMALNTTTDDYEDSLIVPKNDFRNDKTGNINKLINGFVAKNGAFYDTFAIEALLAAASSYCVDGVYLASASHPYATRAGATQSNYGTTALSLAQLDAIRILMRAYKLEGELMGVEPDTLIVGPKLERLALEITGGDRPLAVDNSGAESGTRIGVTTVSTPTKLYRGGSMNVVVTPRFNGTYDDYFVVLDSQFPGGKPIIAVIVDDPHLVALDKETDLPRFMNNEYMWSVEANVGFFPGNPYSMYFSAV